MQKIKHILTESDLSDSDYVRRYLDYVFGIRQAKKDYKVYINLCIIYDTYPDTIKTILDNIPKLGYYKDYFYILMFSKNDSLTTYIYDIIITQLSNDLECLKLGKPISTLGKWLPREKSKINKRCNFIDTFNKRFFPDIKNKFNARNKYRKLKTMINVTLGTIESKMCTKQYDTIDYTQVAPYALKRWTKKLMDNDVCRDHLTTHVTETLCNMTLADFIKDVMTNKHDSQKIDDIWMQNNFISMISGLTDISNACCIIDLSSDTYAVNAEYLALGIALLVNQHSCHKIIINNDDIKLQGSITEKLNHMIKHLGPCRVNNIEKYYGMVGDATSMIVVTPKKIDDIAFLKDEHIQFFHIMPHDNMYDIIWHDGKIVNQQYTMHDHRKKTRYIEIITRSSLELMKTNVSCIFMMVICLVAIYWLMY